MERENRTIFPNDFAEIYSPSHVIIKEILFLFLFRQKLFQVHVYVQGYNETYTFSFFNCKYLFRYTWRVLKAVKSMV